MSDILDDSLREQLAAALLGWSAGAAVVGCKPESRRASMEHDGGQQNPKAAEPGLQHGYIRDLMQYADEGEPTTVADDVDVDNDHPPPPHRSTGSTPAAQKPLPPLPDEEPSAPAQPEMSCRISRFPFSHPCEVPELMPSSQEDTLGTTTSPSASGPATPSVAADVFRPLTEILSSDLELKPFQTLAPEPEPHESMPSTSVKSEASATDDGLGVIREEADDVNSDGVSLLSAPEISVSNVAGETQCVAGRGDSQAFLAGLRYPHRPSVSSLGSGSASSSEWRHSNAGVARRSVNLFSRIRNGGRPLVEETYLEKRSLTPHELSERLPQAPGAAEDELPADGPLSVPSSPNPGGADATAPSRFFRRMPWTGDSQPKMAEAVFGVDLKTSIRVAPMKMRISHKGNSTSYRTFPLSVHKCCEFIRRAGGTNHIFSSPGDDHNVARLKAIFSQPPTYGEDFNFEGSDYTVHDAARLILLFLEELPKPFIPPSVVKSWILLARQEGAIEPPCPRVETGLDFWTEALNRLPTVSRNLTKHLLTLFAELLLAAAADGTTMITETDARQFASTVSKAMFHQDADVVGSSSRLHRDAKKKPARRNVQPTLALAFLIKKRGEYAISLGKAAASKRDSKLFLPSTKEILEWKGAGH